MKVLLINPPTENIITTNLPSFVEDERGYYPPLGLMYIAAYSEKNTDHKIEILDTHTEEISHQKIEDEIRRRKPDIVGIQATSFTLIDSILVAKAVKRIDNSIKIVLGGPHVNIYPEESIRIPEIDYVVLGEGEVVFAELLQNIENRKELKKIVGLVYRDGKTIINTGRRDFIKDLDSLPFPARHLTLYKKYFSLIAKRSPITTMITSRGCPFKCLFCDRPHLGKLFRARSAVNVVEEMEECANMGIKEIFIYDDTFTVNRQRVIDICNEIKNRGLDMIWDIRARVDTIDEALLKEMKQTGCERIHFGVESANQRILEILRKNITIKQVENAFKLCKKTGITTLAYFMIGSPSETCEEIEQTIEFAKKLNPNFVQFSITTPFPATELYLNGLKQGIIKSDYWGEFSKNPIKGFQPALWEEKLTREELISLLGHAYKSFYLRPDYILNGLLKIRSFKDFKRKIAAGLKILGS